MPNRAALLKLVDHWFGLPLCWGLGTLARAADFFRGGGHAIPDGVKPRRIVISKFFGLGSIVLSNGLVRALRARFPDATLVFLTFDNNRELLRRMPGYDSAMSVSLKSPIAFIRSTVALFWFFLRRPPDIYIDLEFYSKFSSALSFLSRARWRVGLYLPMYWRKSLINVPVYFNTARHILDIYGMVGAAVGAPVADPLPAPITVTDDDRRSLDEKLKAAGAPTGGVRLGMNVNASDLAFCRRWPKESFAEVARRLLAWRDDVVIVLTGTRDEAEYTRGVLPLIGGTQGGRVVDLSGRLNFGEYLALLERLDILLTNDSGPFHLAKAMKLRTVSLWGPGAPGLYGPYQSEKALHAVLFKQWPCSPCLYVYRTEAGFFCNGATPCIRSITSEEVFQAVQTVLPNLRGGA